MEKLEIVIKGTSTSDLELALYTVLEKVREGYTSGADRNSTGSYSFDVTKEE